MKYQKQVTLKNGKTCILRNPNGEDAQAILHHMILTSDETDNMLRYPEGITKTETEEKACLNDLESSPGSVMICAVVEGKIVANAGLNPVLRIVSDNQPRKCIGSRNSSRFDFL